MKRRVILLATVVALLIIATSRWLKNTIGELP